MALHHVLYRCPFCGHDPLEGEGDRAACAQCERRYARRRAGGVIRVEGPEGPAELPIAHLVDRIDSLGGPVPRAEGPDGKIQFGTRVLARIAADEQPVRFRGQVLGFVEQMGEGESGRLELDEEALRFHPDSEQDAKSWSLLAIRAVQSASSSIQISPEGGGVVLFRFESDSPVRWESLLKRTIQRAYDRAGKGTISEFQPRIVSG